MSCQFVISVHQKRPARGAFWVGNTPSTGQPYKAELADPPEFVKGCTPYGVQKTPDGLAYPSCKLLVERVRLWLVVGLTCYDRI